MCTIFIILATALSVCAAVSTINRPCQSGDVQCFADQLASISKCSKVGQGSVPNQYTIPSFKFDTPYFNATYFDFNLIVRNHDKCFPSELYYNEAKGAAVLGIDCPLMSFESDRRLVQHATFREDFIFNYHIRGTYPLIRFTINLSLADKLDICSAFVFTDVTALPKFYITPIDKPTAKFLSKDLSWLNIYERELFFWRGPYLARYWINNNLCNFGCQ